MVLQKIASLRDAIHPAIIHVGLGVFFFCARQVLQTWSVLAFAVVRSLSSVLFVLVHTFIIPNISSCREMIPTRRSRRRSLPRRGIGGFHVLDSNSSTQLDSELERFGGNSTISANQLWSYRSWKEYRSSIIVLGLIGGAFSELFFAFGQKDIPEIAPLETVSAFLLAPIWVSAGAMLIRRESFSKLKILAQIFALGALILPPIFFSSGESIGDHGDEDRNVTNETTTQAADTNIYPNRLGPSHLLLYAAVILHALTLVGKQNVERMLTIRTVWTWSTIFGSSALLAVALVLQLLSATDSEISVLSADWSDIVAWMLAVFCGVWWSYASFHQSRWARTRRTLPFYLLEPCATVTLLAIVPGDEGLETLTWHDVLTLSLTLLAYACTLYSQLFVDSAGRFLAETAVLAADEGHLRDDSFSGLDNSAIFSIDEDIELPDIDELSGDMEIDDDFLESPVSSSPVRISTPAQHSVKPPQTGLVPMTPK